MSERTSSVRSGERVREATPQEPESVIIHRCQRGDEFCFEKLFEKYQRRVYVLAYNIVNDHELAKDVIQEAFVRVFRNIRRFDASRNFYTWLYQIVVNLSIDFLRKRSSSKAAALEDLAEVSGSQAGPVGSVSRQELSDRVRRLLQGLPTKYRVVLTLRDIEGFTSEEIAQIVEAKNSTVRWRVHQARKMFRVLWNGEGADSPYLNGNGDDDL